MISLAFKKPDSLFGKAICWKTGGSYCHVEGWLDGPRENAFCFSSREPEGVGFKSLNLTNYTIVSLPLTVVQEDEIRWICQGAEKKEYDWLGILGFVLPWGEHDDHDLFCSECWANILLKVGVLTNIKPWLISPDHMTHEKSLYAIALDLNIGVTPHA